MKLLPLVVAGTIFCAMHAPTYAADADGAVARGASKAAYCYGCHQIEGYRNAAPPYSVPKLAGQHREYIVAALKAYQSGARKHPTMRAVAASLKDEDMADIAAYYAQSAARPSASVDAGKK